MSRPLAVLCLACMLVIPGACFTPLAPLRRLARERQREPVSSCVKPRIPAPPKTSSPASPLAALLRKTHQLDESVYLSTPAAPPCAPPLVGADPEQLRSYGGKELPSGPMRKAETANRLAPRGTSPRNTFIGFLTRLYDRGI
eukprot:CAMPEP_0118968582 /NCGR_PEP_ID=MMETSP1173-20130426/5784_1 /TAXON_ID=1034831 /ORGANISM="Rhizochromulina marina cf, Strain CCMP1243" /LENGTH=141 /DNA_ID=CAMNT_0006917713 /DNA_START=77 /DNA_END=502 /DNA_ORIENTATION=-